MARSRKARKKQPERPPGRWAWLLGIGLLAAAAVIAALILSQQRSSRPKPQVEGYNVLLISMDTTRADHLGSYGHPEHATPNIDRLAAEGTLFEQCIAPVPLTLPTHSSLMTGTDPYVHGVRDNGNYHLHDDNRTLAEALRAAGWATAAEVGAFVLNREFGLDQGFDSYGDTYGTPVTEGGRPRETYSERSAEEVADGALGWLRAHAGRRFFLFVHFFDPHFPYAPPPRFAARHGDPYLGEIASVDEQIGRLLAELSSSDLGERTLVILTADHGESRGQHGEGTHGVFVYDSTMAVPLILRFPGRIPAGQRVGAQVRLIDVAPTVLDFLGLEPLTDAQGESLLPLLNGGSEAAGSPAYGETLFPKLSFGFAPLRMLRAAGWKYIDAPRPELYKLGDDPDELSNLAAAEPQRAEAMRRQLVELVEGAPVVLCTASARRDPSASEVERLEALGYVAGGATSDPVGSREQVLLEAGGEDPKDHVDEIDLMIRAAAARHGGDVDGAERALRDLFARSPDKSQRYWWAFRNLGLVLVEKGQPAAAVEYYERALALRPRDSVVLTDLGLALAQLDRMDEALARFGEAVTVEPVWARSHWRYAQTLRLVGRSDEAIQQFRRALELDPQVAEAWYSLGFLLVEKRDWAGAADSWRSGLALSPADTYMVNNLAWLLATRPDEAVRDGAEAVRLAEQARDATGGKHPGALHTLAAAYAEQGRFEDAAATAHRALELAEAAGGGALIERIREALRLYEAGRPYRES